MGRSPDFIGIGAQKAGTSWIYSCLFEHPQICIPVKEVHFFSRDRNWVKGYDWYESVFQKCPAKSKAGEFSTSYLSSSETPRRIADKFPKVKLVVSLRNPVDRAYSNYLNLVMAGQLDSGVSFQKALSQRTELRDQGYYASQLVRYLEIFPRDQILVMIYEDSLVDPARFIKSIYRFIGVDESFNPKFLSSTVNKSTVPKSALIERILQRTSSFLRSNGLTPVWWVAKRTGLANLVRSMNTDSGTASKKGLSGEERADLKEMYSNEVGRLEDILGRPLEQWRN